MKVFVMVNNYGEEALKKPCGWYLLADSAVTNTGKPFYLPEGLGQVRASLGLALKISRVGKSISPEFAGRYFTEAAPVLHFHFPEYEAKLLEQGLPGDAARNFDRSLFVGEFSPIDANWEACLFLNEEKKEIFSVSRLLHTPEEVVSEISKRNTLKIGDLILPGLSGNIPLGIEDKLEVKIQGERVFMVKVK